MLLCYMTGYCCHSKVQQTWSFRQQKCIVLQFQKLEAQDWLSLKHLYGLEHGPPIAASYGLVFCIHAYLVSLRVSKYTLHISTPVRLNKSPPTWLQRNSFDLKYLFQWSILQYSHFLRHLKLGLQPTNEIQAHMAREKLRLQSRAN